MSAITRTLGPRGRLGLFLSLSVVAVPCPERALGQDLLWQLDSGGNEIHVASILVGRPVAAVPLPPPVAEPFEDPEALVGSYGPAEIRLEDGALFRDDNEFYPVEGRRYYIPASGTVMRFRRDSAGTADAIVITGGDGEERILPRSERSRPRPESRR